MRFKHIVKAANVPLTLFCVFALFSLLYQLFELPEPSRLAEIAQLYFDTYGLYAVFLAAFVEGLFMVNFYFPGSFVIVLGVFFAKGDVEHLVMLGIVISMAWMAVSMVNYYLGRLGFYRVLLFLGKESMVVGMQRWLSRNGRWAIAIAAVHPNFLALGTICFGISRENVLIMMLQIAIALGFWIPFWISVFAVAVTHVDVTDPRQPYYIMSVLLGWAFVSMAREAFGKRADQARNGD